MKKFCPATVKDVLFCPEGEISGLSGSIVTICRSCRSFSLKSPRLCALFPPCQMTRQCGNNICFIEDSDSPATFLTLQLV